MKVFLKGDKNILGYHLLIFCDIFAIFSIPKFTGHCYILIPVDLAELSRHGPEDI